MSRRMQGPVKRICTILLIATLMLTMLPLTMFPGDSTVYGAAIGTFRYGSPIRDANGRGYNWKKSQMAPAYWWDAGGNRIKDKAATYESVTAGMERYTIKTDSGTITGYCVAHGIRVDTTTRMSGKKSFEDWAHTGTYPKSSQKGIEYALIYGYQPGRQINDLISNGFSKSFYWNKNADSYTLDDWYMATQVLIWEYQQLIRTDSVEGGHGRRDNGLVEANHYYSIIGGRAASDIYHYMVSCIKKHPKAASFANRTKSTADNTKGWLMKKDPDTGYYTCTLKDGNKTDIDIKACGTSAKKWEIERNGNSYTFIYKGENLSKDGVVFKFAKKVPIQDSYRGGNMLIWSWSSSGSLRQAIATGVPRDLVSMYIKFRFTDKDEEQPTGEPEPDYWPVFEFPVHKDDKNPGWDGDRCTPMGDASLASTFVLYRNGEEVDRVTLDEYGSTEVLTDQPWTSTDDLNRMASESCPHTETDSDGNVTTHCTIFPTQLEWRNDRNVEYEVVEIPPTARFTETISGTGADNRKYEVSFYAITKDSRTCINNPVQWSDIQYRINYKTTVGTNAGEAAVQGTRDDLDVQLSMNQETWINDNWRGRLLIKKQKESADVFNEEDSSGSLSLSTKSHWKMYLKSGGCENHPYLRFVDDGYTEDGAKKYKVTRDDFGMDNAVTDMVVSDTGSLYITDIPYGIYTVEEVMADDESFVLESFQVDIVQDGKQYTRSVTNKKKENVIKVVKTDAQTGKQINLKGTKFYIRYMGNHLLSDPSQSKNYGKLLPNASNINSTSKDYTFTCNSYGEIVLPYDLEFGTYRLEEFLLPEGYFVGKYDKDGSGSNADYGVSGEYGKEDQGKAQNEMSWDTVKDADPSNGLVYVYDKEGNKVQYKAGNIFNFYTFKVENQNAHMDGEEYTKYYKAVAMKNNPVKGKIEIQKEGEVLAGFKKAKKNGYTIWTPQYAWGKLKDAVFGIFAAIDQWLSDGNDGSQIYDAETGKEIKIPTDKRTHSGTNGKGEIYEEGTLQHESGAKLYYNLGREASTDNHYTRIYTTPEQKPTDYTYSFERDEDGLKYRYDVDVKLKYNAGGANYTDIDVTKVTSVLHGYAVDIPTTDAASVVGSSTYTPAINVGDADGNVFDISKSTDTYEIKGEKVYDSEGKLVKDLGNVGAVRYCVKDYQFYRLTKADVKLEEKEIEKGVDGNGDGKYDAEGEKPPITETKSSFEWKNDVILVNPVEGGRAVAGAEDNTYRVLTVNHGWVKSDSSGVPEAQYKVPEGWTEVPYIPNIVVDEGELLVKNPHYAIITKTEEGETAYKVLLQDGAWQGCSADGNFKKMIVEEYQASYTQQADNENGFTFELDGITISSQALKNGTAVTVIESPFDVKPAVDLGIGYNCKTEGNITTFTAKEPSAPVYFMTEDDVKTEMYYFGNTTRTLMTIPMKAVEGNYEKVVPSIKFTRTGEIIDWFSQLTPDQPIYRREAAYNNTVTAVRHEGGKDSEVYYTVEIISDQSSAKEDGPFEITYADGYTAEICTAKSQSGNDLGVMVIDGVYKTSTAALGDLIETITTGEDGTAVSSELPLGRYIVRELAAPNGYVADTEKAWDVHLQYKDQYTPLIWKLLQSKNQYVKVELDVSKVFETAYGSGQYIPGSDAIFGVYNADPLAYGKGTLTADTLIDTIRTGDNGKALSEIKLPEGVYYLKELKTRKGYILNEIPYYFVAGDNVKSAPLEISKDPDGNDDDGLTAKAVMDGYGRAVITLETLNQYPAVDMIINGRTYSMDQETARPYVSVKVHKDMARTKVTATEDNPAEITLPNGKTLTLRVKGNTYSYTYDGTEGVYVPEVTDSGYYAEYFLKEKQLDPQNPKSKLLVLSAAADTTAVMVQTVHEKRQKKNLDKSDLRGDFIDVVDKEGNSIFDHYADVSLTTGNLTRAELEGGKLKLDEITGPIRVEKGKQLMLKADDKAVYIINMDEYGNIKVSISHAVTRTVTQDNGPKLTIDGIDVTEGFHMTKSVTTARQDSSVETVQVKIHTIDNINAGEIKNEAAEVPDVPFVPMPGSPRIRTTARDVETGDHISHADKSVAIVDTVDYDDLIPGKEYTLRGVIMNQETGEELLSGAETVGVEKKFTPVKSSGTIDLKFKLNASMMKGRKTVIFERLYQGNQEIAKHMDINNREQTVYFPRIKTRAEQKKKGVITDRVEYTHLLPDREYTVKGVLMDQDTGKPIEIDGKPVTAMKSFVPTESSGTVEMIFRYNGSELSGKTIVVFERIYLKDEIVAVHEDLQDREQTVKLLSPKNKKVYETSDAPETGDRSNIQLLAAIILAISVLLWCFARIKKL